MYEPKKHKINHYLGKKFLRSQENEYFVDEFILKEIDHKFHEMIED